VEVVLFFPEEGGSKSDECWDGEQLGGGRFDIVRQCELTDRAIVAIVMAMGGIRGFGTTIEMVTVN
jgi:hypothetical protein